MRERRGNFGLEERKEERKERDRRKVRTTEEIEGK